PGRSDRMPLARPPAPTARQSILDYHLRGRPLGKVDLPALARATDGFSGADLARLCEAAAELAIERALATETVGPIAMEDLQRARRQMRLSTSGWFTTARHFVLSANESGPYHHH